MSYKIEVRPLATLEVIEAYDWYELQQEGLGLSFLNELESFYKAYFAILLSFLFIMNQQEKAE